MKGFIVNLSHTTINNQTYVQLFGRLENGQSFVVMNKIEPYFFIKENDLKIVSKYLKKYETERTKLTNFKGEKVIKISSDNRAELNKLSQVMHKLEIETYEADIKPHYRFIIDNDLLGTINIEGEHEPAEKVERVYKNAKITPAYYKPELKIISIDTESDKYNEKLFCIGIY